MVTKVVCGVKSTHSILSASTKLRTLHLDVKNANSIQEAVNTVKKLLPPGGGIYLVDVFM